MRSSRSDAGFFATVAQFPEFWHFLEATMPATGGDVALRVQSEDHQATVSVWLWEDRPGGSLPVLPELLPEPEHLSLARACVLPVMRLGDVTEELHQAAPVERIDGVFLDALEPVSAVQGWGTLQRNRSVWEKPLVIGGQRFRRGVGPHANSEVTYELEGKYRRFQAWAGPDMATHGTMSFSVVVDGREQWTSGKMSRGERRGVSISTSAVRGNSACSSTTPATTSWATTPTGPMHGCCGEVGVSLLLQ